SSLSPQFFSILACRKYWLIAVSSLYRARLRYSMTLASPFIARPPVAVGDGRTLARRGRRGRTANRVHSPGSAPECARTQAAAGRGSGRSLAAWYAATRSAAVGRQVPQVAPQPVRMVSSATLSQPAWTASRIWRSVTPLQMQTYTAVSYG